MNWAILIVVWLASACSVLCFMRITAGEAPGVSAHWGGLGGGTSGWRISAALVWLIGALFFWTLSGAAVIYQAEVARLESKESREREDARHREEREDHKAALSKSGAAGASAVSGAAGQPQPPASGSGSSAQRRDPMPTESSGERSPTSAAGSAAASKRSPKLSSGPTKPPAAARAVTISPAAR